ncbi:MAG: M48 family metallopeptidase [Nanoarchaeota archaeon]|nr:M48 family metallopeptidase [Nanoarchaeota archaeon]MBU4299588.1 M48 family metallopeptidase [Nanoarchaeota archaeon]MBU4452105.1 M48 family metallopeptidase [Nanoarchaeota archaeon]
MQDQISANRRNSILLMLIVPAIMVLLIYSIGMVYNPSAIFTFLIIGTIFSMVFTIGSYYYSDKIVLATTGARPATKQENAFLVNTVEGLALAAGMPAPRIYVLDSPDINAFATGRDPAHGIIVVTTGIMQRLNRQELEGVVAHEMSHIANFDIRFATLIAVLVGMVSIISQMFLRSLWFNSGGNDRGRGNAIFVVIGIVLAILAPIVTHLIQLAVSRQREYLADANGAFLTRYPEGLASALEKISKSATTIKPSGAVSHLFFANPVKRLNAESMFSTHPPIDERIKRLRAM